MKFATGNFIVIMDADLSHHVRLRFVLCAYSLLQLSFSAVVLPLPCFLICLPFISAKIYSRVYQVSDDYSMKVDLYKLFMRQAMKFCAIVGKR